MNSQELLIHTQSTQAFIEADKLPVVIRRRERVSLSSGGYSWSEPTELPSQDARLIPSQDKEKELETDEGKSAHPDYVLLMMPGADIQRWDRFSLGAFEFLVLSEPHGPAYEVKVDVMRCGR
jgi:hypothetical protein